jgi:hypothetical protein
MQHYVASTLGLVIVFSYLFKLCIIFLSLPSSLVSKPLAASPAFPFAHHLHSVLLKPTPLFCYTSHSWSLVVTRVTQVLGEVIKAGATTLNIPETVGWSMPHEYSAL